MKPKIFVHQRLFFCCYSLHSSSTLKATKAEQSVIVMCGSCVDRDIRVPPLLSHHCRPFSPVFSEALLER